MRKSLLSIGLLLSSLSCSDSSDPETLNPEDLSPPLQLQTVTGSGQIELRWQGVNFEDDLAGYHVFVSAANKGLADLTAPAYPTGVSIAANQTVPFCVDNAKFFAEFGITTEPSGDCEGAKSTPSTGFTMLQEATTAGVAQAAVTCYDPSKDTDSWGAISDDDSTAKISLAKQSGADYRSGIGVHRCLVKTDNTGAALVDGQTYSIFVVAVAGDDYSGISWTSNVVEDTPAAAVFDASLTLDADKYKVISFDTTDIDKAVTFGDAQSCSGSNATNGQMCSVYGTNESTTAGIHIGRDVGSSVYQQRIFISAPKDGELTLLHRGDKLTDPISSTLKYRVPGDQAVTYSSDVYRSTGKTFIVRDRQVYDFVITRSGKNYYGKVAIGDVAITSKEGTATIPVQVVVQSKAGSLHYAR